MLRNKGYNRNMQLQQWRQLCAVAVQLSSSLNITWEFNDSFNSLTITVRMFYQSVELVTNGGVLVSTEIEQILFRVAGTVLYFDLV